MKTRLLLIILFLFSVSVQINAQKNSIEGTMLDSLQIPLVGATVILMEASDSTMTAFGITGNKGQFQLDDISVGDYILQVTYIGYENYSQNLKVANENKSLREIVLSNKDMNLSTVIVEGERVPMLIKKDTIIYDADAFGTQPTDVVEDLLKKLPGVEVGRDGSIRAQGERVQNVLVDGKEFFGDDPTIATKNLPADAVDKVEVYDKQSEMAEFTGIEDGNEEKTINLSLKDGKKHGYFGNVSAGYGTENRFQGKGNINRFGAKMQLSAIGMANNVNEQGFSPNEYISFMGGLNSLMSGGVSLDFSGNNGLPIATGLSNGFVDTYAGGLNFNYDFGKKTELRSSYFYNQIKNQSERIRNRENFLGTDTYSSNEENNRRSGNQNHRLNVRLEQEVDSMRRLTLRSSIGFSDGFLEDYSTSETLSGKADLENDSEQFYDANLMNLEINNRLTFKQRFRKKGRSFVANLNLENGNNESISLLKSLNRFYINSNSFNEQILNQEQNQSNKGIDYGARFSYTEPLGKSKYLEISASHQNYSNDFQKDFYDVVNEQKSFNELLSDLYQRDYVYNRSGLRFKKNSKKSKLTLGVDVQQSLLQGTSQMIDEPIKNSFFRVLPTMRWNYDFTQSRSIRFDYRTYVQEPSLEQLQPIVNNTDPLNIYIGNPDLQAAYEQEASLEFMSFDQFSGLNIFGRLEGIYTTNRISNTRSVDSLFRQTIRPVNVKNDFLLVTYLDVGFPLKFIKSRMNIGGNLMYNKGILFLNDIENKTNRWTNSYRFDIENRKKEKFDISIGGRFTHTTAQYSESQNLNQDFLNQSYFTDVTWKLNKKWHIGTTIDYTLYSKETYGSENKVVLWSAFIARFLMEQKAQIKLSGFDLLNQNIGISRNSDLNYLEETRIQSLARYFMLTFSYSMKGFDKKDGVDVKIN